MYTHFHIPNIDSHTTIENEIRFLHFAHTDVPDIPKNVRFCKTIPFCSLLFRQILKFYYDKRRGYMLLDYD